MRLPQKPLLLAILCIFASAATAYAECSWVLWAQHPKQSNLWSPETAYPTSVTCNRRLDELDAEYRKQNSTVTTRLYATKLTSWSTTSEWAVTWQCLPDTVDPRGTVRGAEDKSQEEYALGRKQGTSYFAALYTTFGMHYRTAAILEACGHQAEAKTLRARVDNAVTRRLSDMMVADVDNRIVRSITFGLVAQASATSMVPGYSLGYQEGLAMATTESVPSWYRESLCDVGWKHREDDIPDTVDPRGPKGK